MLESDSDHHAFLQSTQYHMVVRLKACGNVTVGGALSSMWNPLGQNHLARRSERGKKTTQTEEEVGRQHREWTGLEFAKSQSAMENREKWRKLVAKSVVVPQ